LVSCSGACIPGGWDVAGPAPLNTRWKTSYGGLQLSAANLPAASHFSEKDEAQQRASLIVVLLPQNRKRKGHTLWTLWPYWSELRYCRCSWRRCLDICSLWTDLRTTRFGFFAAALAKSWCSL